MSDKSSYTFQYQLLDRLRSDCKYVIQCNTPSAEKHLWAGNVKDQIKTMKEIYENLPDKPEWLTMDEINDFETKLNKIINQK